jgi:hypothetical protein
MRILHVGNIANNGYLAAKKEREYGYESYLINVNAHHVMMMPEWEELNLEFEFNQYSTKSLRQFGVEIPYWVLSGVWSEIHSTLFPLIESSREFSSRTRGKKNVNDLLAFMIKHFRNWIPKKIRPYIAYNVLYRLRNFNEEKYITNIFASFDFIILYGPFCSLSKFIKNGKYIAFEHGTLRNFVHTKYKLAKNTKLGFMNAAVTLVSNQDCLNIARTICKNTVIKSPHPINDKDFYNLRLLRYNYLANNTKNYIEVLVPARHTFSIATDIGKGNEAIYSAIKKLFVSNENIVFHLIRWGENLPHAIKELAEIEKAGFVKWHNLMTRPKLREFMIKSDAIIDQLLIPAFGGISIDAIGLGVPLLTNQQNTIDIEYFGSVAPIFSVNSADSIVESLKNLKTITKNNQILYFKNSCNWFDQNLTSDLSLAARLKAYQVLE